MVLHDLPKVRTRVRFPLPAHLSLPAGNIIRERNRIEDGVPTGRESGLRARATASDSKAIPVTRSEFLRFFSYLLLLF